MRRGRGGGDSIAPQQASGDRATATMGATVAAITAKETAIISTAEVTGAGSPTTGSTPTLIRHFHSRCSVTFGLSIIGIPCRRIGS
mmetsp:Transcript_17898/g.43051  ORF Transcript_17898/g.43051 Transcript_17898/m.43051 type:complete len:86 (+) Transcript_17898:12-269(+)